MAARRDVPLDVKLVRVNIGEPGNQVADLAVELGEVLNIRCAAGQTVDNGHPQAVLPRDGHTPCGPACAHFSSSRDVRKRKRERAS